MKWLHGPRLLLSWPYCNCFYSLSYYVEQFYWHMLTHDCMTNAMHIVWSFNFFFNCFWLWTNSILLIIETTFEIDGDRDDNGVVRGQRMGFSSLLRMVLFCPLPAPPRMTEKTFSPHPRPLGPREAPSHPVELYFLLVCPTTSTIFLMKPISLIKIYLKLQLNWSHQIQSIFRKKIE